MAYKSLSSAAATSVRIQRPKAKLVDLDDLKNNWNDLGRIDPLWAILAAPESKGNRWDIDDFFATGEQQVNEYLALLRESSIDLVGGTSALDFGCGAGRLTRALGQHFEHADGVDIASSMIALAEKHNRDPERVSYHLNETPDLALFDDESFDLLISIVVLQHMNNVLKSCYIREFCRVLRPGGIAMFTVPSHADWSLNGIARRLPNGIQNVYRRRRHGHAAVMELHTMNRKRVEKTITEAGCEVRAVLDDQMAGPPWKSYLFVAVKPPAFKAPNTE